MEDFVNVMTDGGDKNQTISTLVFMDLEATGLPSFVGRKNVHITEMSFVAIDREDFETDSTLRVLNKLSLCVRPRTAISPTAMTITGLYNDVLEKQEKFDDSIPKLLEYFFRRLRRPLCLLAHNGKRYDFPLLQAELKKINYSLDSQILCADTLQAIKFIVSNPITYPIDSTCVENDKSLSEPKLNGIIPSDIMEKDADPEVEILLSQDMDIFSNIEVPNSINTKPGHNSNKSMTTFQTVPIPPHAMEDERTPPKPTSFDSISNMSSPHKKAKLDPACLPKNQYKNGLSTNFHHVPAKRQLFTDGTVANKVESYIPQSKPLQFSLEKLYCHYFGKSPPSSHYAEADCMALSKVCQKINKEFLKWIDENSTSFSETKAMW